MNNHPSSTPDASDAGPLLSAHALNELSEREQGQVEQLLAADPQAAQTVEELKRLATALRETCADPADGSSAALREAVVARLDKLEGSDAQATLAKPADSAWRRRRAWSIGAVTLGLLGGVVAFWAVVAATDNNWSRIAARSSQAVQGFFRQVGGVTIDQSKSVRGMAEAPRSAPADSAIDARYARESVTQSEIGANSASDPGKASTVAPVAIDYQDLALSKNSRTAPVQSELRDFGNRTDAHGKFADQDSPSAIVGLGPATSPSGTSSPNVTGSPRGPKAEAVSEFMAIPPNRTSGGAARPGVVHTSPGVTLYNGQQDSSGGLGGVAGSEYRHGVGGPRAPGADGFFRQVGGIKIDAEGRVIPIQGRVAYNSLANGTEQYEAPPENAFLPVDKATALSTFSIDVDTASYANVRRFLSQNQLPPPAAVRIEEMLNYFRYTYPQPQGEDPFSVSMELADCPWQPGHELLRIGIKGKEVEAKERKAGNLVFLIDVSGSMQPENKLPLLKQALKMLVGELTENDTVTICTYAGDAGLKLDATNGTRQNEIRSAIDSLTAGGSTHGSAGIELAYQQAAKSFIKGGTNRVILATDGDLNVGITDDGALVELIKAKAAGGVFLTVLGVGEGNLKDAKMEKLADNGNGVYAYLDNLREARKVLVEQLAGSLETIAKDVKIQIEFNPAEVAAYRLIGYENRVLATQDFHDDKKDAGEIGAGHTVTALYELVPARAKAAAKAEARGEGEPLKYQKTPEIKPAPEALTDAAQSGEALTLKLRFKHPDAQTSQLREYPLKSEAARFNRASADFQFAAAVASFGMLLKNSQHRGDATFSAVEEIAAGAIGPDPSGYRAEFLDLVRKAKTLGR